MSQVPEDDTVKLFRHMDGSQTACHLCKSFKDKLGKKGRLTFLEYSEMMKTQ